MPVARKCRRLQLVWLKMGEAGASNLHTNNAEPQSPEAANQIQTYPPATVKPNLLTRERGFGMQAGKQNETSNQLEPNALHLVASHSTAEMRAMTWRNRSVRMYD